MYLIDSVVPREIHEFYISVFSFPISMDEIRTDRMVESVNLSQKWIGFEGKHNDNDDDDFGDLDTRAESTYQWTIVDDIAWIHLSVLSRKSSVHALTPVILLRARKKKKKNETHVSRFVRPAVPQMLHGD